MAFYIPQVEISKDWILVKNYYILSGSVILYLFLIYVVLPWYMKNRKAYELKTFIQCYNIFQIISCLSMIYMAFTRVDLIDLFSCQEGNYSKYISSVPLANFFWWHMMLKAAEFIETFVFALRKKNNQISGLHVYHHISTYCLSWAIAKHGCCGMISLAIALNSSVHVLMYSYYFLASFGPEMQKRLSFIKSKLTIIQLIQLVMLFCHTLNTLSPNCDATSWYPFFYLPVLAINIVLFYNFYQNTYVNKKSS